MWFVVDCKDLFTIQCVLCKSKCKCSDLTLERGGVVKEPFEHGEKEEIAVTRSLELCKANLPALPRLDHVAEALPLHFMNQSSECVVIKHQTQTQNLEPQILNRPGLAGSPGWTAM